MQKTKSLNEDLAKKYTIDTLGKFPWIIGELPQQFAGLLVKSNTDTIEIPRQELQEEPYTPHIDAMVEELGKIFVPTS